MKSNGRTKIVILGAGFGGVYTAMHLEKLLAHAPDVDITLVNRENFFLFTPMLHEVAASDLDITHIVNPIRKLLHRANFFEGEVEYIDFPNKCVGVSHGYEPHQHDQNWVPSSVLTRRKNWPSVAWTFAPTRA